MRAVIAVPPLQDFYFTPHRASALGARAAERVLKALGWKTLILNLPLTGRGTALKLPGYLHHLQPYILPGETGPTTFFRHYRRFGPSSPDAADLILSHSPDLVLISCFAWAYATEAGELTGCIKEKAPGIPVILGGGATVLPEYFLPPVNPFHPPDFILRGEAEVQLPELLASSVPPALSSCADGPRVLPFDPEHAAEDLPVLWGITPLGRDRQVNLHLSRGCTRRCRFCSNFLTQGRRFRRAPLSALESTLEEIRASGNLPPGSRHIFNLEDDNLLLEPDYMLEALDLISRHFPGAVFKAENGLDYLLLSEDLMEELIRRGFGQFNFSLVQATRGILEHQERNLSRDRFEGLISLAERKGVKTISYFIAGLPGDNGENLCRQLVYLASLPTEIGISLFYPVPGLPGFEDPAPFLGHPPGLCTGSAAWPWGGSLSTREMITAFRLARTVNFLKRKPVYETERERQRELLTSRRLLTWFRGETKGRPVPEMDGNLADAVWMNVSGSC